MIRASLIAVCVALAPSTPFAQPPGPAAKPKSWNVNQPPGAARSVSLDVRSGTWMGVDVSPDGKQIAFVSDAGGGEHYWYAHTEVWKHPLLSRYLPKSLLEPRAVRRPVAPTEDYNILQVAKTATELSRAGVKTSIGAHGQREGLGAHWEMWMFALGGMTPLEALRTATLTPAQVLGLDRDLGSLEVGKLADLVIIDGDVTKDIRLSDRVVQVMQNGRLYDAATMNEIGPGTGAPLRQRRPFFFEGAASHVPLDEDLLSEVLGHGHVCIH